MNGCWSSWQLRDEGVVDADLMLTARTARDEAEPRYRRRRLPGCPRSLCRSLAGAVPARRTAVAVSKPDHCGSTRDACAGAAASRSSSRRVRCSSTSCGAMASRRRARSRPRHDLPWTERSRCTSATCAARSTSRSTASYPHGARCGLPVLPRMIRLDDQASLRSLAHHARRAAGPGRWARACPGARGRRISSTAPATTTSNNLLRWPADRQG